MVKDPSDRLTYKQKMAFELKKQSNESFCVKKILNKFL